MIRVLRSAEAAGRLEAAHTFLRTFPVDRDTLVVSGTREAADDFARDVSRAHGATFGLHRFSLLQLASRLATADLARRGLVPGTRLGIEAVVTRAAFQARQAGTLTYFEPVARCPGFARALASTLENLRGAGVEPGRLEALEPSGHDLSALLRRFDEEREAAKVTDVAVTLDMAARALDGALPFSSIAVLLLDVAVRTRAEHRFVEALLRRAVDALATVPDGDAATHAALLELGATDLTPAGPRPPRTSLDRLRVRLFSAERDGPAVPESDDGQVLFFSAPGEAREAVEIARRILVEARRGVAFDRIAILLRAPTTYGGLIETALGRAGVPVYFTRGTRRPDPAGRAFLALLACAAEGFSARRFAEYLSLGQVPTPDATGAPPAGLEVWVPPLDEAVGAVERVVRQSGPVRQGLLPFDEPTIEGKAPEDEPGSLAEAGTPALEGTLRTPWKWEELLVDAAVIGGRDRWTRRLAGLEAELGLRLRACQLEEPEAGRARRIERDLINLRHLRRFALPLIEALDSMRRAGSWGEWLDGLSRLAPMALGRPERVLTVLAELRPLSIVGPVDLDEVREVLTSRLSTLEDDPPARRFGCVFVGTPGQARGRSFEVVFVPGLAERTFPQKTREDPLLLDAARTALGDSLLDRSNERILEERLLLRLAAGAATRRLHLSYPRMGLELGEARPRVPSFYALDVVHATTGEIPALDRFERAAFEQARARLAWPAPTDPDAAIDEFERDLAVLSPLLHGPASSAEKGRARYLLELNPHLRRSLRTRWSRWERRPWSSYDGLARVAPRTVDLLRRHRPDVKPYSVSSLQHYAACPYRFLLAGIHRLEPREEPVALERLDPLTRGSIFHEVQAETMRALERAGRLPMTDDRLAENEGLLDQVLDAVAERRQEELAPAIRRVWLDGIEAMRADLRMWLRKMTEGAALWRPIRFELGFGMPRDVGRDPRSVPGPVTIGDRYLLHGVVDLVETRHPSGELRVTDYKTGGNYTKEGLLVGGGETLQPVLYGLAVEAALGTPVSEARLFYCTSRGGFTERRVAMTDTARAHGLVVLETIDRAIEAGLLVPAPRDRACDQCDFLQVCGPQEEERAAKKDQRQIADLLALRRLP